MGDMEKHIGKLVAKAIFDYDMIQNGDRILVAASGGKDSTTLVYDLASKQKHFSKQFEIEAIHIASDFCSCCKTAHLEDTFRAWEVTHHIVPVPVLKRLKPGKTMNCYWCSTQRRTELIKFALEKGFSKIALGHHLDDVIETFFMNMLQKSELSTMLPVMRYRKFPVTIIRPLALVEERHIIEFARQKGFESIVCTCPYGENSKRKDVRKRISRLTGDNSHLKRNIFNSMSNVRFEYLLEQRTQEEKP